MSFLPKKVLVLCIDRDNDIGRATGTPTPIIGRENFLNAALSFAMHKPEDSDVNAMFAALQLHDSLLNEGVKCQIALISGLSEGGVKADAKIASELDAVLSKSDVEAAIFVSDGAADEQVLPLIQSRIPIFSIKRVFVQQSKSVEETYVVLSRYLKKIVEEPQYSKIFLGVPGAFILVIAILQLLNLLEYATAALLIGIGFLLAVKGFRLDELVKKIWAESPIRFATSVIAALICGIAIAKGAVAAIPLTENPHMFIATFTRGMVDLFIAGLGVFIGGRFVVRYLQESPKMWHDIVMLIALVFIWQIVAQAIPLIENPAVNPYPLLITVSIAVVVLAALVVIFTLIEKVLWKAEKKS
ncbi:MAG: hypothetical protein DRJ31_04345 [Candidatus Methanomethylicota archaeon]|uniref:DUF373 family protein n=1 Tax=Thermoproteota archaeon TaxID=2056631 RepID=A0A497ESP5_9CREN|nr:MAG: hypothetical protein DRJ31_04345 [Candidatus Verstraetearchaeota archaeon]RLE52289.1 MAG: hypothetical protein DRJ33_04190 [Candidatus Verstraetearchaeota archaeon]